MYVPAAKALPMIPAAWAPLMQQSFMLRRVEVCKSWWRDRRVGLMLMRLDVDKMELCHDDVLL